MSAPIASLSEALLVVKGAAQPISMALPRARRTAVNARPRVSMRIDETQHRRLRLAAAHLRKSVHAVLLDALDHYLDQVAPGSAGQSCACLGGRAADTGAVMPFRLP